MLNRTAPDRRSPGPARAAVAGGWSGLLYALGGGLVALALFALAALIGRGAWAPAMSSSQACWASYWVTPSSCRRCS